MNQNALAPLIAPIARCKLCGDELDQCSEGKPRPSGICVLCEADPPQIIVEPHRDPPSEPNRPFTRSVDHEACFMCSRIVEVCGELGRHGMCGFCARIEHDDTI